MIRCLFGVFVWLSGSLGQVAHAYTFFYDKHQETEQKISYWPQKNQEALTFWVDGDPFTIEGQSFFSLVQAAASYWTEAKGTSLRIQLQSLSENIDHTNFARYQGSEAHRALIVLEQDGRILQSLGLDPAYVIGLGVPIVKENKQGALTGPFGGEIIGALVLINTGRIPNARRLQRILTHELGHALGLGHTNIVHLPNPEKLPVMFFDTGVQQSEVKRHEDDTAAIASLYPSDTYESHYGSIRGQVLRQDRTPVFGAVVIAQRLPEGDPIGAWSDEDGRFALDGLLPGRYQIHTRALDGSPFLYYMEPRFHIGGSYKDATNRFCPEAYNDRPFQQCRIAPDQYDLLTLHTGERLEGLLIREGQGNPSPPPVCRLGSAPALAGLTRLWPPNVTERGKRDAPCPAPKEEEKPREASPETTESIPEKDPSPEEPLATDLEKTSPPPPVGCQCNSTNHADLSFLFFAFFFSMLFFSRIRAV